MVKTLRFGDQQVPVPGFGAMGLNAAMGTDFNYEQSEPVLLKAMELGCTFWDTAVAYKQGENEKILGEFIKKHNVRDKVFGEYIYPSLCIFFYVRSLAHVVCAMQLPPSVDLMSLAQNAKSPIRPLTSRNTLKGRSTGLVSLLIFTTYIGSIPVRI